MNHSLNHSFGNISHASSTENATHHIGFRTTAAEKTRLLELAGRQSLGAYIRNQLLGENVRPRKKQRIPKRDDVILCKVLAALGNTRLSSNLNQIAKSANRGALPVTEELVLDLESAALDIRAMRMALMMALGFSTKEEPS